MGEPGTATACAAASPQEALGYENRGREAKRTRNGGDGRESVVVVYTSANRKGERQYQRLWRGIKRASYTRKENRTAWRRLPIVYARSESPGITRILAAFVPHRHDFIANLGFLPFSDLYREFITEGIAACIRFVCGRISIRTEIYDFCY